MIPAPDGLNAYFGDEEDKSDWVSVQVTAFDSSGEALYVHLGWGKLARVSEIENFRGLSWE